MKVNHRIPKETPEGTVRERDLQRTIDRLKAANADAVRRAAMLTVERDSLRAEVARLRRSNTGSGSGQA